MTKSSSGDSLPPMTSDELNTLVSDLQKKSSPKILRGRRFQVVPALASQTPLEGPISFADCVFDEKVDLSDSQVNGKLMFQRCTFRKGLYLERTVITGDLRISDECVLEDDCVFYRLQVQGDTHFENSTFSKGCSAIASRFGGLLSIEGCRLRGEVDFSNCIVTGGVECPASVFQKPLHFNASVIKGDLLLMPDNKSESRRTVCMDVLDIISAKIGGDVYLQGIEVAGELQFHNAEIAGSLRCEGVKFLGGASFYGTQVGGSADFGTLAGGANNPPQPGAQIGPVLPANAGPLSPRFIFDFSNVTVKGNLKGRGAQFHVQGNFNQVKVSGHLDFSKGTSSCTFHAGLRMKGARIEGEVHCEGIVIHGADFLGATFAGSIFGNDAFFVKASFHTGSDFSLVHAKGLLDFSGSEWTCRNALNTSCEGEKCRAQFRQIICDGDLLFKDANFSCSANFEGASIKARLQLDRVACGQLFLRSATCGGLISLKPLRRSDPQRRVDLCLENASFPSMDFGTLHVSQNNLPDFPKMHLCGATYSRLHFADLGLVIPMLVADLRDEGDSRIYVQLEKCLRDGGYDHWADRMYWERNDSERRSAIRLNAWSLILKYTAHRCLANYGVRPFRLVAFAIGAIALAAWMFVGSDSLQRKPEEKGRRGSGVFLRTEKPDVWDALPQALAFSIHEFIPVNIPLGSSWEASEASQTASWVAALLKGFGVLIIPIGVAAMTGFLRNKKDGT